MRVRVLLTALLLVISFNFSASAGNYLVQGGKKIGDCDNVHVGLALTLNVMESGSFSGNYRITVSIS